MFDKGVFLRGGERMVEEGTQVLDDLPLVFLHVLEPDELHIVPMPAFPTSYNVLPVVSIKLQIFKYQDCQDIYNQNLTCSPALKSSANWAKSPTKPDSGSLNILNRETQTSFGLRAT